MASKNHVRSLSATERSYWRDIYGRQLEALTLKFAGRRRMAVLERDAADSADRSVQLLRERITWSRP